MKLRGVIISAERREISIKRLRSVQEAKGLVLKRGKQSWLAQSRHAYVRWKPWFRRGTYYLLKDGDASPLVLRPNGITTDPQSAHEFDSSRSSHIADRVLRGGLDWKTIALVILGIIAFVAVIR